MRILFITTPNLIAADVARRLSLEGHEVRLCISGGVYEQSFDGLVHKTRDWRQELPWIGREGLIIFDDTGFGVEADQLRCSGYRACGGSQFGDRLEMDRPFGQHVLAQAGMMALATHDFDSLKEAIRFVEQHRRPWVIKQNDHYSSFLTYVGRYTDARDVIEVLRSYQRAHSKRSTRISLQEKIEGVEIGVARYFNGKDWLGPIEINLEHKKLFPGDVGEFTSEMGTVAWYEEDETCRLFQDTLARLKPTLIDADYRGDIDINCIVNDKGAFPLEITARFGSPIVHLHSEMHLSPWGDFLAAIADGRPYDLRFRRGYGIVVLLAAPPFPYGSCSTRGALERLPIFIDHDTTDAKAHLHYENVMARTVGTSDCLQIAKGLGYVLYVTGTGQSVEDARSITYKRVEEVYFPKMFYRNDIGVRYLSVDRSLLSRWGYL